MHMLFEPECPLPTRIAYAVATTTGAVSVGIESVVPSLTGVIVGGMAAGTVRSISRGRPVDGLGVALVTPGASETEAVIQRFIA